MSKRNTQRGDTIVEVMFSFVIFSMVVVASISLMNKGTAMAQRSLETTLVRQQIDGQVSLMRDIQAHDKQTWSEVLAFAGLDGSRSTNLPEFGAATSCPTASSLWNEGYRPFFLGSNEGSNTVSFYRVNDVAYKPAVDYARINTLASQPESYGIVSYLAEAENKDGLQPKAYDYYVFACWDSVGVTTPMTIGTVTRLYGGL